MTLVVRPGALGDAVLTLPALHALRLSGADNLLVLGTPASWAFVRNAHDGLRIRDFSSAEWLGLFAEGAALGECARAALARTEKAVVYLCDDNRVLVNALKSCGVREVLCVTPPRAEDEPSNQQHASRQLTAGLAPWVSADLIDRAHAIVDASEDIFIRLSEDERHRALFGIGLDAVPAQGFIAIHPGSGGRKKCWPAERFAKLAVKLACRDGAVPLVFFGPADETIREQFEASIPPGVEWQAVVNRPLRDVLALLSHSRAYIGNDSGVTHLAARVCPTLALFGPSKPNVWLPNGRLAKLIVAPSQDLFSLDIDAVYDAASEICDI